MRRVTRAQLVFDRTPQVCSYLALEVAVEVEVVAAGLFDSPLSGLQLSP